eukprot:gene10039-7930_t
MLIHIFALAAGALLWGHSAEGASGSWYCDTFLPTPGSAVNSCPLCAANGPCTAISTVDKFHTESQYCFLPDIPATAMVPTNSKATPNQICQQQGNGWVNGVKRFEVFGAQDSKAPATSVGTAWVFVAYTGLMYVTMQLDCNLLFSTDPTFVSRAMEIGVWRDNQEFKQYVNVVYTSGFYSCYTLAIDLNNVCDVESNSTFNPSRNDPTVCDVDSNSTFNPSRNDPTLGTCVRPDGSTSPPVNLFVPGSSVSLNVNVKLARFNNNFASAVPMCSFNSSEIYPYTLFSNDAVFLTIRTPKILGASTCTDTEADWLFLTLNFQNQYTLPAICTPPQPGITGGSVLTVQYNFLRNTWGAAFVRSIDLPSEANQMLKLILNVRLRLPCGSSIDALGPLVPAITSKAKPAAPNFARGTSHASPLAPSASSHSLPDDHHLLGGRVSCQMLFNKELPVEATCRYMTNNVLETQLRLTNLTETVTLMDSFNAISMANFVVHVGMPCGSNIIMATGVTSINSNTGGPDPPWTLPPFAFPPRAPAATVQNQDPPAPPYVPYVPAYLVYYPDDGGDYSGKVASLNRDTIPSPPPPPPPILFITPPPPPPNRGPFLQRSPAPPPTNPTAPVQRSPSPLPERSPAFPPPIPRASSERSPLPQPQPPATPTASLPSQVLLSVTITTAAASPLPASACESLQAEYSVSVEI